MQVLLIAVLSAAAFVVAYHTYGRWLGSRVFRLAAGNVTPAVERADGRDYVPTGKAVVFGHHFTSIAGTGPIVGPAIAVMWGWVPALLWVVFGSIFIGAVHDFGSLVVSLRHGGRSVGDVAGDLIGRRARLLFLAVLFLCLLIVIAIFGLVIASVLKLYPAAIVPVMVQVPLAVAIGVWLHKRGVGLVLPSLVALVAMYASVIFGDAGVLGQVNAWLAALPLWAWVLGLLAYGYVASVLPVWALLQPRDFINALQLLTALGLIVAGLAVAALVGGPPPVDGADRQPLEIVAPAVNISPAGAPAMLPFLFITIACGACSGFHCLVSSGTSSKQLKCEPDARFVGYGSMLTEGFLAVLVILACVAGIGLGTQHGGVIEERVFPYSRDPIPEEGYESYYIEPSASVPDGMILGAVPPGMTGEEFLASCGVVGDQLIGETAYYARYRSWHTFNGLGAKVGAFVDGSGNFVAALGVPRPVAVALMAVLVASFAGTTLDTAVRLQRYVVEEIIEAVRPLSHDLTGRRADDLRPARSWLPHVATVIAVGSAAGLAAVPSGTSFSLAGFGKGALTLWPLFGATNQLLAGLAFAVIVFYLRESRRAFWFALVPMGFMLVVPAWAMALELPGWWADGRYVLAAIGGGCLALEVWMVVEACVAWGRAGRQARGFEVVA